MPSANWWKRSSEQRRLSGRNVYMKKTTIAFTGDIGFDHHMAGKWEDEELIAPELTDALRRSDHVVINVEGALVDTETERVQSAEMRLMHTIDPAAVRVFERIGADIWCLVNNHIMDVGPFGVERTLEQAKKAGVQTFGAGMNIGQAAKPVILEEAGGIGLFGVGYRRGCKPAGEDQAGCFLWNDMDRIRETIREIKKNCRWCVPVVHGGEEFTALPSPYTRDRYLEYLDMGADAVVCHHPHVPMNYERVGEKAIFYSLGNFIFDTNYQRAQFHTDEGIVLFLTFTESDWSFKAQGIRIDREKERVVPSELPAIFTEVPAEEYELLAPLAAKMLKAAYQRQQLFLYPEKFRNASEADWTEHFLDPKRSGRVPGEALDFTALWPLIQEAEEGAWKKSRLEGVKEYILGQM